MKAMVLCAGLGTRLRPLTNVWPKPAMPFLGQPLLRYTLAVLRASGIRDVGINTHHLPERMAEIAARETSAMGMTLFRQHEPVIQGTGGGIRGLRAFLEDGDFVVFNGDVLFALDLQPLLEAHRASKADATMVLLPMPEDEKYAAVETDVDGRVWKIAGRGHAPRALFPWHFTGVHILTPKVFEFMNPEGEEDINRSVYIRMMERGLRIQGHVLPKAQSYWSDIGTPRRYLLAHQDALFGRVPMERFKDACPWAGKPSTLLWAHPSAQLSNVRASGPAFVAEGAMLGRDVQLGAAVSIGRGAQVGQGACLNRVAVLDGAHVPAGVQWEDCIVAPHLPPLPMGA